MPKLPFFRTVYFCIIICFSQSCEIEENYPELNDKEPNRGNAVGTASVIYEGEPMEFSTYKHITSLSEKRLQMNLQLGNRVLNLRFPKGDTGQNLPFYGSFTTLSGTFIIASTSRSQELQIVLNDTLQNHLIAKL
jgi:hypothetical protein